MASSACFALLFVALACPFAFAQLVLPSTTWPPVSSSGTCNNTISEAILALFSPNNAFSRVVINSITYVNSTFICPTVSDSEAEYLLSTIKVYLFYGPKATDCQIETLGNIAKLLTGGHWNFSRTPTFFFPGWLKSATSEGYSLEMVDAYYTNGSYNLLILDWSQINTMEYTRTVSMMPQVARKVAAACEALARASNVSEIIFVGHSLGAHLAGYIARRLHGLIKILAALDPAGPLFGPTMWRCQEGISSTDAAFVMALHSDWGRFGIDILIGTVDYFVNNGTFVQPSCTPFDTNPTACKGWFLCSHTVALLCWCDAIRRPGSVIGRLCPSAGHFTAHGCDANPTNDITSPTSEFGTYFFKTNAVDPIGIGMNGT